MTESSDEGDKGTFLHAALALVAPRSQCARMSDFLALLAQRDFVTLPRLGDLGAAFSLQSPLQQRIINRITIM